ncbi:MAG: HPP family protein [Leucobacter sp.]
MSTGSKQGSGRGGKPRSDGDGKPSPGARRKQIIVGLVMGAIVGVVIGAISQFWLWVPAGLAFGLAVGAIMKPPAE